MAEKVEMTTYTEEEIRNVVESLREGLDYDQMWARYGNWNPRRTSTTV